jgi:hypothetical protein
VSLSPSLAAGGDVVGLAPVDDGGVAGNVEVSTLSLALLSPHSPLQLLPSLPL